MNIANAYFATETLQSSPQVQSPNTELVSLLPGLRKRPAILSFSRTLKTRFMSSNFLRWLESARKHFLLRQFAKAVAALISRFGPSFAYNEMTRTGKSDILKTQERNSWIITGAFPAQSLNGWTQNWKRERDEPISRVFSAPIAAQVKTP